MWLVHVLLLSVLMTDVLGGWVYATIGGEDLEKFRWGRRGVITGEGVILY